LIKNVPYYEKIENTINERELNAKICEGCGKKDTEVIIPFKYKNGKLLCSKCFKKKWFI
jgi:formylmethanofuran dehydrogenase subunit E